MEKLTLKVQSSTFFKCVILYNLCKAPVRNVLQWWNLIKSLDTSTSNSVIRKLFLFFFFWANHQNYRKTAPSIGLPKYRMKFLDVTAHCDTVANQMYYPRRKFQNNRVHSEISPKHFTLSLQPFSKIMIVIITTTATGTRTKTKVSHNCIILIWVDLMIHKYRSLFKKY